MAKKESTLWNLLSVLGLITFFSSALLGGTYLLTREPIAAAAAEKKNFAIKKVLPGFDNHPGQEQYTIQSIDQTGELIGYPGFSEGKLVGTAVETFTMKGFNGLIRLMVGFDPDGKILNISVLEQKETPGLGTRMTDKEFQDRFIGKNPGETSLKVRKDGGDIDAITAATISSRAFCDAVQRAYDSWKNHTKKND